VKERYLDQKLTQIGGAMTTASPGADQGDKEAGFWMLRTAG